jgi:hypothetical protein
METIFTNYINWLNSKTEQYVEYERDEKEKSVYFKKYTEIPSVFKFCLYISIPVIGWIYGIKKTEK